MARPYSMTKRQFDRTVAVLIHGGRDAIKNENEERVFMAVAQMVRLRRLGPTSEEPYSASDQEIVELLTTADPRQRKKLKAIAELLTREPVPMAPGMH